MDKPYSRKLGILEENRIELVTWHSGPFVITLVYNILPVNIAIVEGARSFTLLKKGVRIG